MFLHKNTKNVTAIGIQKRKNSPN